MKKPTYKGKELLPLSVIDAARDGDSQAVDQNKMQDQNTLLLNRQAGEGISHKLVFDM